MPPDEQGPRDGALGEGLPLGSRLRLHTRIEQKIAGAKHKLALADRLHEIFKRNPEMGEAFSILSELGVL